MYPSIRLWYPLFDFQEQRCLKKLKIIKNPPKSCLVLFKKMLWYLTYTVLLLSLLLCHCRNELSLCILYLRINPSICTNKIKSDSCWFHSTLMGEKVGEQMCLDGRRFLLKHNKIKANPLLHNCTNVICISLTVYCVYVKPMWNFPDENIWEDNIRRK